MCCAKLAAGAVGLAMAATGIGRADAAVIATRRALCRDCPEAVPCAGVIGRKCQCRLCDCVIRAKTANADEKCPEGKW
jgi:hypothetical protein